MLTNLTGRSCSFVIQAAALRAHDILGHDLKGTAAGTSIASGVLNSIDNMVSPIYTGSRVDKGCSRELQVGGSITDGNGQSLRHRRSFPQLA